MVNEHILRIARIDSVVVLHPAAHDLDVAHRHVLAPHGHDGPGVRTAEDDVFDGHVGCILNANQLPGWPFHPGPVGAVKDARPQMRMWSALRTITAPFTTAPPAR